MQTLFQGFKEGVEEQVGRRVQKGIQRFEAVNMALTYSTFLKKKLKIDSCINLINYTFHVWDIIAFHYKSSINVTRLACL